MNEIKTSLENRRHLRLTSFDKYQASNRLVTCNSYITRHKTSGTVNLAVCVPDEFIVVHAAMSEKIVGENSATGDDRREISPSK